jgi:hypothetical protein
MYQHTTTTITRQQQIDDAYGSIIDEETFECVQLFLSRRTGKFRKTRGSNDCPRSDTASHFRSEPIKNVTETMVSRSVETATNTSQTRRRTHVIMLKQTDGWAKATEVLTSPRRRIWIRRIAPSGLISTLLCWEHCSLSLDTNIGILK